MTYSALEIIAIVIIVISIIKMAVFLSSPKAWIGFARNFYAKPGLTVPIALVLAAVVLYFLVESGMTIVEILAAWAFMALVLVASLARYTADIFAWAEERDLGTWLREQWLLMVVWTGLVVWGIVDLFFS